ncbi:MAG TPA: type II restriction endonuclease [Bacilli bacterium]|nr:type II restriction endonuclease [Bacillota bacterium]OQC50529.1 MAG: Type-2 restriction enzyme DpnII [Tenericutes bacterium ADurb.Bin024]HOE54043.1 type II restriction endonuclease [Bacilli bacterium]HOQ70461.1 type II restriction endonuclease [Bacilli bacterium]
MSRNFEEWLSTFRETIATWDYYTDFNKVYRNVDAVKVELNILNSLIGSDDIRNEFISLVESYPHVLQVVPLLLAKRENTIKINTSETMYDFDFKNTNYSIEEYANFMDKTGLFNLLKNRILRSLLDYVTGIEVGMDTNARKNRMGKAMEDLVEEHLKKKGFVRDVTYFKEMSRSEIQSKFGLDLSNITNEGKAEKRFDFVIKTKDHVYAIETNFYSSSGSKLNETARSYELLARESATVQGFTFIWITDGLGWRSARNNLRQTFEVTRHIYNIADLENDVLAVVLK